MSAGEWGGNNVNACRDFGTDNGSSRGQNLALTDGLMRATFAYVEDCARRGWANPCRGAATHTFGFPDGPVLDSYMAVVSDSHYQSTLDDVYVHVVPWSEIPIVLSYTP